MSEAPTPSFVHLRAHTEFSMVDGILRIKPTLQAAAEMQMPALALTDLSNLFAAVKFYRAAESSGVKPLIGCDFLLHLGEDTRPAEVCLLVKDATGYANLVELISRSWLQGQVRGTPYINWSWIEELHEGLICLSGAMQGEVGQHLLSRYPEKAGDVASRWQALFADRFYLEVQRTGKSGEEEYLHAAVELAASLQIPLVATNQVRFLKRGDFEAHEARTAIHDGMTLADPRREQRFTEEQYLKSPSEMTELFSDLPEALQNSLEIARRCSLDMKLGEYFLPEYPTPQGMDEPEYLRYASRQGLKERMEFLFPDSVVRSEKQGEYQQRLEEELDIIIQMGFPGYFLIVMDFIQWAKNNSIPVGPGRGSGAGSLVAYALKITDLDPIEYDLLFERFLNPERVSMPDFDVDFCMEGRDRVIDYVAERYGRDAVSQIVTFGTMAAKAVVKDVARVQGKSYGLADRLSKMIPFEVGMTLSTALEQETALQEFLAQDGDAQEIWEMAEQLEGITRNCGKHAGGVVIAPTRLTDFAPLYCDDQGQSVVTQFDKNDVEAAGLVKFDFLGLKTLTIIDWALNLVNKRRKLEKQETVDINAIPLDDSATFELLQSAETAAVFQLESRGMRDLIKRLRPSSFEDIIALVALFRPGPLQSGMVDDFINRKHGREQVAYPHPTYQHDELVPVLEPTYGIILYQEQVMQIAQVLAGFSLGQADLLRRAMGKKNADEMAKQRKIFLEGASQRGISAELASNIFDLMEKFAGYGFNKSHSAAYALIAYQTAWLKTHYPAEFMAAVMSADMQNTDKIVGFIDECRRLDLQVAPPDVNVGRFQFSVDGQGKVIYGLGAIKGLGEGAIQSLLDNREKANYQDIYDFCKKVDSRKFNRRALEALVRSGALDKVSGFPDDPDRGRALLEAAAEDAMQIAEQVSANRESGMTDMFGEIAVEAEESPLAGPAAARPWSLRERLQKEKETLGLYLTGHPVEAYRDELRVLVGRRLADLVPSRDKQWLGGLLVDRRIIKTRRGDRLCILTLDDRSARVEVTLFPDMYTQCESLLVPDSVLAVEGTVETDDYSGGLRVRAENLLPIIELRNQKFRYLCVEMAPETADNGLVGRLKGCLSDYLGGACSVRVRFNASHQRAEFELGEQWQVEPRDELLHELRHQFGQESVSLGA